MMRKISVMSKGRFHLFVLFPLAVIVFSVAVNNALDRPTHQATASTSAPDAGSVPSKPSPEFISSGQLLRHAKPEDLFLRSSVALVLDKREQVVLYGRNIDEQRPIASLTKLMTAMVCLDARLPLDERITISRADRDRLRGTVSRLSFGTVLTRYDALSIALAASENRAAHALARTYPGGKKAFVRAMNAKARQLGMKHTTFKDPAGLHSKNVSTASDLAAMVDAAGRYELIADMTTEARGSVTDLRSDWKIEFLNTNRLVRRKDWAIGLSKTGYIADAGNCLVMEADISGRPVIIVLLNSWGKLSRFGDSNRIRKWLITTEKTAKQRQSGDTSRKI